MGGGFSKMEGLAIEGGGYKNTGGGENGRTLGVWVAINRIVVGHSVGRGDVVLGGGADWHGTGTEVAGVSKNDWLKKLFDGKKVGGEGEYLKSLDIKTGVSKGGWRLKGGGTDEGAGFATRDL